MKPRPTLYPSPKNLFLERHDSDMAHAGDEEKEAPA